MQAGGLEEVDVRREDVLVIFGGPGGGMGPPGRMGYILVFFGRIG